MISKIAALNVATHSARGLICAAQLIGSQVAKKESVGRFPGSWAISRKIADPSRGTRTRCTSSHPLPVG
jgi:hypothetical protein